MYLLESLRNSLSTSSCLTTRETLIVFQNKTFNFLQRILTELSGHVIPLKMSRRRSKITQNTKIQENVPNYQEEKQSREDNL